MARTTRLLLKRVLIGVLIGGGATAVLFFLAAHYNGLRQAKQGSLPILPANIAVNFIENAMLTPYPRGANQRDDGIFFNLNPALKVTPRSGVRGELLSPNGKPLPVTVEIQEAFIFVKLPTKVVAAPPGSYYKKYYTLDIPPGNYRFNRLRCALTSRTPEEYFLGEVFLSVLPAQKAKPTHGSVEFTAGAVSRLGENPRVFAYLHNSTAEEITFTGVYLPSLFPYAVQPSTFKCFNGWLGHDKVNALLRQNRNRELSAKKREPGRFPYPVRLPPGATKTLIFSLVATDAAALNRFVDVDPFVLVTDTGLLVGETAMGLGCGLRSFSVRELGNIAPGH